MNILKLSIFFLFLTIALHPQQDGKNNSAFSTKPKYYQDFLNFKSDRENMTRLDVFIQVPYSEVQFVKSSAGFEASYSVTVTILDPNDKKMITERTWTDKVETIDFQQTTNRDNFNLSMRSFHLSPGKYLIRTEMEDKDSRNRYSSENIFTVRDLTGPISLSDPMIVSQRSVSDDGNKIIPNISRNVPLHNQGMDLFYEIYSDSKTSFKTQFLIIDKDQKVVYDNNHSQGADSGKNQYFFTINEFPIGIGNYILNIRLKDENDEVLSEATKSFVSRWSGVPSNIADLDKAISQMVYIATPSEISHIEKAEGQQEKIQRFTDYWKKKDPTPNTDDNPIFEEYYRRIAFSNANFSSYIEGWRSDRGMVYTILGAPSNIDRHPFNYDSKPYEVWEYYEINRRFIFLDETGFGDYRLITPLSGDSFRYRY